MYLSFGYWLCLLKAVNVQFFTELSFACDTQRVHSAVSGSFHVYGLLPGNVEHSADGNSEDRSFLCS
jgi:hypothetical protein